MGHFLRGEPAKFVVHEGQELIPGLGVPLLHLLQNERKIAHDAHTIFRNQEQMKP
jgi:hypothetical protein